MTRSVESLSRRRAFIMMLMASTYLTWQVPSMDWVRSFEDGNRRLSDLVADLGQIGFALIMLTLVFTSRQLLPKLTKRDQAVLEDELVKANRRSAMQTGYLVMMLMAAFLFLLSRYQPISGNDVARILLCMGVAAPLYRFAFLELKDA